MQLMDNNSNNATFFHWLAMEKSKHEEQKEALLFSPFECTARFRQECLRTSLQTPRSKALALCAPSPANGLTQSGAFCFLSLIPTPHFFNDSTFKDFQRLNCNNTNLSRINWICIQLLFPLCHKNCMSTSLPITPSHWIQLEQLKLFFGNQYTINGPCKFRIKDQGE